MTFGTDEVWLQFEPQEKVLELQAWAYDHSTGANKLVYMVRTEIPSTTSEKVQLAMLGYLWQRCNYPILFGMSTSLVSLLKDLLETLTESMLEPWKYDPKSLYPSVEVDEYSEEFWNAYYDQKYPYCSG